MRKRTTEAVITIASPPTSSPQFSHAAKSLLPGDQLTKRKKMRKTRANKEILSFSSQRWFF
jgi:hypothetical protein